MNPDDLIHRLHEVIDTALWDSFTVEEDRAVGRAEVEACEAERREAEAVRDEVIAAIRRLADVIEYTEQVRILRRATILDLAREETNERESNESA